MGVAERKERHKEELKNDILRAAKELFMEKGFEATSIRNIAEKIEYSPATIYLYYKDKNDIVHALHQDGFKLLIEHFQVINDIEHPFERLKAMGKAYIQFAMKHPDVYQLIFTMKEPLEHVASCQDEWHEGDQAFTLLQRTVEACQAAGYFKGMEPVGLSFVIWSTMHGMCTLRTSGHLEHMTSVCEEVVALNTNVDDLMMHTYHSFVSVLERLKP
ncbi:MAG: TetR/AcrR family transcriptional regulator [Cyclobacteriaceae bacterium]